jgi:hypothetical protein
LLPPLLPSPTPCHGTDRHSLAYTASTPAVPLKWYSQCFTAPSVRSYSDDFAVQLSVYGKFPLGQPVSVHHGGLTVGDWQRAPEGTAENPALVNDDDDIESTIEVDNNEEGLLYTAREVEEGVTIKEEREVDVITDSGAESEERFDLDSESVFDDDLDGDEDMEDENIYYYNVIPEITS